MPYKVTCTECNSEFTVLENIGTSTCYMTRCPNPRCPSPEDALDTQRISTDDL